MYERTPYPIAFGASPIRRLVLPGAKGSFRYACRGSTDKEYAWTIPGSFGSSVCVAAQLTVMTSDGGSDVFAYDPPLMKKVR